MKSGTKEAVATRPPYASFFLRALAGAAVLLTFLAFPRAHFAKQNSPFRAQRPRVGHLHFDFRQ